MIDEQDDDDLEGRQFGGRMNIKMEEGWWNWAAGVVLLSSKRGE